MRIGCHVSISGSLDRAVDNATERNCTAFQIFTRNPRGWHTKNLDGQVIDAFKTKLKQSGIDQSAVCVHMPYLPNLASPDEAGFKRSVASLTEELDRCSQLNVSYVVTHLGSHLGTGEAAALDRLEEGLNAAVAANDNSKKNNDTVILLENTAGQKNSVGHNLKQLGELLERCKPARKFGVCFDTCHAFVAGYDLRTREKARETFAEFDKYIGLDRLKILHLNDAKGALGSHLDRHYHIGLGEIGEEGMAETIKIATENNDTPIIMETPINEERDDVGNIKKAKELFATI